MTAQTEPRRVVPGTPAVTSSPWHAGHPETALRPTRPTREIPRRTAEHSKRAPPPHKVVHHMTEPILEAKGLSRSFGHVRALDAADFDVNAGEVVALIGDNGAGKSTLVKALTGNLALDSGEILFDGKPVHITSPQQASALGIEVVYQDLALAPHLNPAQNMFLGRELSRKGVLGRLGFMDDKAMRDEGRSRLRRARRHGALDRRRRSARCPVASGSRSPSPGPSAGPTRSSSSTSPPRPSASCRPRTSWRPSSGSRPRASPWSSSRTPCRTCSRSPTGCRCCAWAAASRPTTPRRPSVEELVGAMTGALDREGEAA